MVSLSLEEIEAVRLKDLEGLEQEECAVQMAISRPTFQRVLASARRRIACALLMGKAIRIEGGNFRLAPCCLERDGPDINASEAPRAEPGEIKAVRCRCNRA